MTIDRLLPMLYIIVDYPESLSYNIDLIFSIKRGSHKEVS